MNKLFLNKKVIEVPGSWDELEASQMLQLVPLLQVRMPDTATRLRALLILLNIRRDIRLLRLVKMASDEDQYDMLMLTDFIWETRGFTKQKFPQVDRLYGPGDNFKHVVFFEYIQAEKHYLEFSKNAKPELLDKMVACLWRPADAGKGFGDLRQRYSPDAVPLLEKEISLWPLSRKLAIYLWFDSCRQQLIQAFPKVFSGTGKVEFNPTARPKGWIDVAATLAENVTKVEEVLYQGLYMVMFYLSNKIEEAQELERKHKK